MAWGNFLKFDTPIDFYSRSPKIAPSRLDCLRKCLVYPILFKILTCKLMIFGGKMKDVAQNPE